MIAQAIPSYTMSVFCLPETLCEAFQLQFNAFWWGQINIGVHSLDGVQKSESAKEVRGSYVSIYCLFNQSMLAKQEWRLLLYDDLMVIRELRARYFQRSCRVFFKDENYYKGVFTGVLEMVVVLIYITVIGC